MDRIGIYCFADRRDRDRAKVGSKPRVSTSDEFERRASEETTMLGATMNALHDVTDPAEARSKEVIMQMKDGTYRKKKREGKANSDAEETL